MGYPIGYFMFKNVFTFVGLLFGAVLTMMVVYIQPVNVAFGTWSQLTPLVWLIAMAFGVLLLIYSMVRTAVARSMRPIKYSKPIDGLDLRPTRLSTVKG